MAKVKKINVCCPYFDTIKCGDTTGHKHIYCLAIDRHPQMSNDQVALCVSDNQWSKCKDYKEVKDESI